MPLLNISRPIVIEDAQNTPVPDVPQDLGCFTVTSNGDSLLIWGEKLTGVLKYGLNTCPGRETVHHKQFFEVIGNTQVAAGGRNVTAVLSNTGGLGMRAEKTASSIYAYTLFIFRDYLTIKGSIAIEPNTAVDLTTTYITVSKDDSMVALCLNGSVYVYRIGFFDSQLFAFDDRLELYRGMAEQRVPDLTNENSLSTCLSAHLPLSFSSSPTDDIKKEADVPCSIRERRLSLSPTSNHLVVATLLSDDHVYVDCYSYEDGSVDIIYAIPSVFKMPTGLPADNGMTSLFLCEPAMESIFVADVARPYQMHILHASRYDLPEPFEYGKKVIAGAQAYDGRSIVILNAFGELMMIIYHTATTVLSSKEVRKLKKASESLPSGLTSRNAAVGIGEDGSAVVMWRTSRGKLMCRVVQLESEQYSDHALN